LASLALSFGFTPAHIKPLVISHKPWVAPPAMRTAISGPSELDPHRLMPIKSCASLRDRRLNSRLFPKATSASLYRFHLSATVTSIIIGASTTLSQHQISSLTDFGRNYRIPSQTQSTATSRIFDPDQRRPNSAHIQRLAVRSALLRTLSVPLIPLHPAQAAAP